MTFGQVKKEELVTETVSVERAFSEDVFTTEDTEGTEKGRTLSLMNADDTDRQRGSSLGADVGSILPKEIEYKLPMDLYRMDTQEGMQAYEAEFRRRRKPWLDREYQLSQTEVIGTLPEGVIPC